MSVPVRNDKDTVVSQRDDFRTSFKRLRPVGTGALLGWCPIRKTQACRLWSWLSVSYTALRTCSHRGVVQKHVGEHIVHHPRGPARKQKD